MSGVLFAMALLAACFGAGSGDSAEAPGGNGGEQNGGGENSGDSGGENSGGDDSDESPVPFTTVSVPVGRFTMGCEAVGCDGDEAPAHEVIVSAFVIDVYEVTVAQFAGCVEAGQCTAAYGPQGSANHPIVGVTYTAASQLCAWRRMSVPTEAQWERAARGDDDRTFPWGEEAVDCTRAASRACDGGLTQVGTHPIGAGPFGTQDQAGNAWEWVSDAYDAEYYAESPDTDPTGPTSGGLRTVRGMDLWSDSSAIRASNRNYAIPTGVSPLVGFRCAGDP